MRTVGQHAVGAGESILVQKWNSLEGRQVHYTDAVARASNDCWQSLVFMWTHYAYDTAICYVVHYLLAALWRIQIQAYILHTVRL